MLDAEKEKHSLKKCIVKNVIKVLKVVKRKATKEKRNLSGDKHPIER